MVRQTLSSLVMFAAVLFSMPVSAGLSDVRVRQANGVITVEVTFTEALNLEPAVINGRVQSFELQLSPAEESNAANWSASELEIDESDNMVSQVSLTGDAASGMRLRVQLRESAYVELLPQYLDNHVLFTLHSVDGRRSAHKLKEASSTSRGLLNRLLGRLRGDKTPPPAFVLTLEDRREVTPTLLDIPRTLAESYTVYASPFKQQDETWQRLRVGFFTSEKEAVRARAKVVRQFPDTRIEQVSADEVAYGKAYSLNPELAMSRMAKTDEAGSDDVRLAVVALTPSSMADAPVAASVAPRDWQKRNTDEHPLMEQADDAFRMKDYGRATSLYTRVVSEADGEVQQLAFERLGIARELKGQTAQAARVYRDYLSRYPTGQGARRVQQRLDSLAALKADVPAPLRKAARARDDWQTTASISQYYRRHTLEINGRQTVPIDGVFTDLGVGVQKNTGGLQHKGRASVSWLWDFTGELENRDVQISRAYWDTHSRRFATGLRVGRQSKYEAGVIGRFDGAMLYHELTDQIELGAVGGYVVDSAFDMPNTDRPFYGVFGSFTSAGGSLRVSPFLIQQQYQGVTDRQAVGLQSRYINGSTHIMGLVDYDFYHSALNNITIMADLGVGKNTSFNISADQRRSPYVTTRNALIGQPFDELSDLERELVDVSLKDLADNRATTSRTLRLGWNHRFSNRWEASGDVLAADFSSTEASMNVAGYEARQDLYYTMQVRAVDIFGRSSYSGVSIRQSESDHASTRSLFWDNRVAFGGHWMVQPRLRFDYREFNDGDQVQTSTKPSLRLSYRWNRTFRFELETGYEITNREMTNEDYDISGFFVNAGYRAVF